MVAVLIRQSPAPFDDGRITKWVYRSGATPDEKGRQQIAERLGAQEGDIMVLTWERDHHAGCPTSGLMEAWRVRKAAIELELVL